MSLRRLTPIALTAVALLATEASPAAGYGTQYANFSATISGSYVNEGSLTSSGCFRYDEEAGGRVPLPDMTAAHSEHTAFRSVRPAILGIVNKKGTRRITSGGKPIPVAVTMRRRSDLATPQAVRGCTPIDDRFDTACGTRTQPFQIKVYSPAGRPSFSYNLSNGFSTVFPADPFECPPAESSSWWAGPSSRGNGVARVRLADLFDPRKRRIVVTGTLQRPTAADKPAEGWKASATETLRWTLVLRRRAG